MLLLDNIPHGKMIPYQRTLAQSQAFTIVFVSNKKHYDCFIKIQNLIEFFDTGVILTFLLKSIKLIGF